MFAGPAFGPWWAGGPRGWRGPKARRGDVRAAILAVLAEQPMNGYQIIQEIATRSGGVWKPSPGSIYPTLQQLEDEGLVRVEADGGRRVYTLTDEGRTYVNEHADEVSAPWQAMSETGEDDALKPLIGQVATAVWQIMATGTPAQQAKGRDALIEFRRKLYSILAEDDVSAEN
jgi:DNA-binding PadR family transcriptional regulator